MSISNDVPAFEIVSNSYTTLIPFIPFYSIPFWALHSMIAPFYSLYLSPDMLISDIHWLLPIHNDLKIAEEGECGGLRTVDGICCQASNSILHRYVSQSHSNPHPPLRSVLCPLQDIPTLSMLERKRRQALHAFIKLKHTPLLSPLLHPTFSFLLLRFTEDLVIDVVRQMFVGHLFNKMWQLEWQHLRSSLYLHLQRHPHLISPSPARANMK